MQVNFYYLFIYFFSERQGSKLLEMQTVMGPKPAQIAPRLSHY